MQAFGRFYMNALNRYPVITKSLTAGTLMFAGDVVSQGIESARGARPEGYDVRRSLKLASLGMLVYGPTMHYWYRFLASKTTSTVKMVLADQLFYGPSCIAIFFVWTAALDGHDSSVVIKKIQEGYLSALKANYAVWPAAQALNFLFVPLQLRAVFVSFVSFGWNVYMSYMHAGTAIPTEQVESV